MYENKALAPRTRLDHTANKKKERKRKQNFYATTLLIYQFPTQNREILIKNT
jgi:hypothetical protein